MPVRGRFYLTKSANGDLTGEFSHDRSPAVFTETAIRTPADQPPAHFTGTYQSHWIEDSGPVQADLTIIPVEGSDRLVNLRWNRRNSTDRMFNGQAMIVDQMLIGDYQSA